MLEYDPLSPALIENPYPFYARLRERQPVFWHEKLESWVFTRYKECAEILRDSETFASDWRRAGYEMPEMDHPSLQVLDPPDHAPVRHLFMSALHHQDLDGIGALVAAESAALFEKLASAASFDFVEEVARPVTLHAVCRVLGVNAPETDSFVKLADAVERGMDAGLVPEALQPAIAARREIDNLMESWLVDSSGSGVLGHALRERKGLDVPEGVVWSTARVLFLAGFSTTVSASVNAVLALLGQPELFERIRSDRRLLDTCIDELIRYDSPIQGTSRACVEDVTLAGERITRGQSVMVLIGSANRDPDQFAAPDELVPDRRPNQHLAFGRGPHACTGSMLAKVVLRALLTSLLELPGTPRPAGPVHRRPRATLRYPERLPLTFHSPRTET
ncbi:cytochrome P450 [Streptomyces spiramyceticus]|uniref:cytochrome P450 n=1 Tax=Streptomyces spiramyceticus TaxID=299717 RepID=UPI00237BE42D|nr:cytochrome P450 [Streptomyces spiramyceticus]